jgi:hypothetical protein
VRLDDPWFGPADWRHLAAPPRPCDIAVGELVPTAQVARPLAEVIIRGQASAARTADHVLRVDQRDQGNWLVSQSLPASAPRVEPDAIVVTHGGGGLQMRIDRCNGAISDVHYIH